MQSALGMLLGNLCFGGALTLVLLSIYLFLAVFFSFICSIAEAVILSVTTPFVAMAKESGKKYAAHLAAMKANVSQPLSAILTLNTVAHTVGAAGAGSQAAKVFGDVYVGLISGVLTIIILVFSEIIPKTLGARYWQQLAPVTTRFLYILTFLMKPFVIASQWITDILGGPMEGDKGPNRHEISILAKLSQQDGYIDKEELLMISSLLANYQKSVQNIVTPRTVVFSLSSNMTVKDFFEKHGDIGFSRIPVYDNEGKPEFLSGFVLRSDLLLAKAEHKDDATLKSFARPLMAVPSSLKISTTFHRLLSARESMGQVIDEYGGLEGIVTTEDLIESILGFEIVDESDQAENMQTLARQEAQNRQR